MNDEYGEKQTSNMSGRMKKRVLVAAAAFMVAALLFSGVQLWRYLAAEKETEEDYGALADLIELPPEAEPTQQGVDSTDKTPPKPKDWTVQEQYGGLFEQNTDMIGWISIEGTQLNYPVMQTPNAPNYYLRRGFSGQSSDYGVPYAAESCSIEPASDNITIYGHHMKSGKLFGALDGYTSKAFCQQHPTIRFDTHAGFGEYAVLAVFKTTPADFAYHEFVYAENEAEFDAYVSRCKALAFYETGVTANHGDKLITLSTCEYTQADGRLVVVGVRV